MPTGQDTPGVCAITNCGKKIRVEMLMCRDHWRRVPLVLQRILFRVWRNARAAGGVLGDDAYAVARDNCIAHVERQRRPA